MTDPIIDLLYRLGSALIPRTEEPCGAISGHGPNFKALNHGPVIRGLVIRMMTRVAGRSARMAE